MVQHIIPECYVDTTLTEMLTMTEGYNHQKGCGTVAKVMRTKFLDRFACGIIDKDKKDLAYLNEFNIIVQTDELILYKHKTRHHYFIQIVPAMEVFILHCAATAGLDLSNFNLPTTIDELTHLTKTINTKYNQDLRRLFTELRRQGIPAIQRLSDWINYLKTNPYTANPEVLSGM